MENYCNICGRPLNENGFCDDPECNIPNGFTKGIFVKNPTKYWSEIVNPIEPTWEHNNFE